MKQPWDDLSSCSRSPTTRYVSSGFQHLLTRTGTSRLPFISESFHCRMWLLSFISKASSICTDGNEIIQRRLVGLRLMNCDTDRHPLGTMQWCSARRGSLPHCDLLVICNWSVTESYFVLLFLKWLLSWWYFLLIIIKDTRWDDEQDSLMSASSAQLNLWQTCYHGTDRGRNRVQILSYWKRRGRLECGEKAC